MTRPLNQSANSHVKDCRPKFFKIAVHEKITEHNNSEVRGILDHNNLGCHFIIYRMTLVSLSFNLLPVNSINTLFYQLYKFTSNFNDIICI